MYRVFHGDCNGLIQIYRQFDEKYQGVIIKNQIKYIDNSV